MFKKLIIFAITGSLFFACKTQIVAPKTPTEIKTIEVDSAIANSISLLLDSSLSDGISTVVCGTIQVPKYLKDLNRNDVFTSNISLDINSSLNAYGFEGKMGKKDVLIVSYLTKYKDYSCENTTKRALIGIKLYVHASELKIKTSSPTLPMLAAAVELGLAKAEYRFQTFGINPDDFYNKLPSAQFTVDTYSKVISAYDNIVHSLKDSTEIDPIISDISNLK